MKEGPNACRRPVIPLRLGYIVSTSFNYDSVMLVMNGMTSRRQYDRGNAAQHDFNFHK